MAAGTCVCGRTLAPHVAFHHFTVPQRIFNEMVWVLKPNEKLVLIDRVPGHQLLRDQIDYIESLRDPSPVKVLNLGEM